MKTYLVGGAVRDKLLGLTVKDKDWIVVGATVDDMLARGFRQVGRDFPVFLHPQSNEEYALARTERKAGKGYTGFTVHADKSVTLEDDLKRRDLTINAMAETEDGRIIDPYGGRADLEARILRHVSEAFVEDPLRVLRVARFAARFADYGFVIAPETQALMSDISNNGELEHLVMERVWQETQRALGEAAPEQYFSILAECGALARLMPELAGGFPDTSRALKKAVHLSGAIPLRFAVLCANLSENQLASLNQRLPLPNDCQELAALIQKYADDFARLNLQDASAVLALLQHCDAFRRTERFGDFLLACRALAEDDDEANTRADALQHSLALARGVDTSAIAAQGFQGKDFARELEKQRIAAIADRST